MIGQYVLAHYDARMARAPEGLIDMGTLARAAGLHSEFVERLYRMGLLDSSDESRGEPLFTPASVARLRLMMRLRNDLGLGWIDLGLVVDLIERIDALESKLREFNVRPAA